MGHKNTRSSRSWLFIVFSLCEWDRVYENPCSPSSFKSTSLHKLHMTRHNSPQHIAWQMLPPILLLNLNFKFFR
ncbi:hypothetical protein AAZX31_09G174600 [Glycine max]